MLSKNFRVGDLVWAKMKGFPPWPAKIIEPPSDGKSPKRKGQHYVYFFGSNNHAWILDENIEPHSEQMLMKQHTKKKSAVLKSAIESIINCSKSSENNETSEIEKDIFETDLEKDVSEIMSSEDDPPIHIEKTESGEKSPKEQQYKKRVIHKTPLKRPSSHSEVESFKRRYSSLSKDEEEEEVNDSLSSSLPSKMLKPSTEQSSTLPGNEIGNKVDIIENYKPATEKKIGFLGLSPMNRGIVSHLLWSGHSVSVWNKSPETCDFTGAGVSNATKCATPAEVVKNSDITFCCSADPDTTKVIVFDKNGVLSALEECGFGKSYVEMTTFDPRSSEEYSEVIKRTGTRYLEAPFSNSLKEIGNGEVSILAAGDHSLFFDCESCFNAIAKSVYFISKKVGDASKMNLINNSLTGTAYAALAEALALTERLKIPESAVLQVLQNGYLKCPGIMEKASAIFQRHFKPDLPLKHVQRDMSLALFMGGEVDRPSPVTAAANEVYKHAKLLRYSDHDVSAVYQGVKY